MLLVDERTLFPVLMPLAPAATLMVRFAEALQRTLQARGVAADFIESEIAAMAEGRYAKTANRSVVGIMNEFRHPQRSTGLVGDSPISWPWRSSCQRLRAARYTSVM